MRPWQIAGIVAAILILGTFLWIGGGNGPGDRTPPTPTDGDPTPRGGDDPPANGGIVDPVRDPTPPPPIDPGPQIEATGRVIDAVSGRGVFEATVTVTESRDPRVYPLTHARTNSAGVFFCRFPERDGFELTARAEGYAPARWTLSGGQTPEGIPLEVADLELNLAPESVLWIRTDLPGLPSEETVIVEVQLRQARTPVELGEPLQEKQSAALLSPETRVGGLAMGQYLLSFRTSKQRLGTQEVELAMGEERTIEFVLGPPVPISGTVRHNGRAVAGGKLVIWGRDHHSNTAAVVDDRGGYRVSLPAPGRYSFAFSPAREDPLSGTGGTRELEIETPGEFDLEFHSSRLVGRVVGARGEPVPQISGTLFGPHALSFVTDDLGEFEFVDVPHGTYRWLFPQTPERTFGAAREFDVSGDTEVVYEFELASELEVRVRRDPLPERDTEVGRPQVCLLEAGGVVTPLRPAGPDRYLWPTEGGSGVVVQRGWAPWFFEITPSENPAPITAMLVPGGELTVTIFTEEGHPSAGHDFRIDPIDAPSLPAEWSERHTGPRGNARLGLPPGTYRVVATIGGAEASREIRIHERSATEARLP